MLPVLSWIGRYARWVLVAGSVAILFLPSTGGAIRPHATVLVALVLSLTMARIDLADVLRRWRSGRHFAGLMLLVALLLPATALLLFGTSQLLGLGQASQLNLLVFALAAPIGSAAGMCFMLGWDAKRALEATLLATFAMPLVGPAMLGMLVPGAVALDSWALLLRLLLIIGAATVLSLLIRKWLTAKWIEEQPLAFDGATSLVLLLFLLPVFDGMGARLVAEPGAWFAMLGFACLLNFGASILTILMARGFWGESLAGALGIMWGNRNVGVYLAAIPAAGPELALFVALYQFPMYFTPLVLSALFHRR